MNKEKTIKVTIDDKIYCFAYGITLEEILVVFPKSEYPIVAAYVNGYQQGLDYSLIADTEIQWIDINSQTGLRIYRHSQRLLLLAAHNNVLPLRQLFIRHSLGYGTFCESRGKKPLTEKELDALKDEMERLIKEETPIKRIPIFSEDARIFYQRRNEYLQAELLQASGRTTVFFYELGDTVEAFHGRLATNCNQLPNFSLSFFEDGFILFAPTPEDPHTMPVFSGVSHIGTLFNQCDRWAESLEISRIGELNRAIEKGRTKEIIEMAETMQIQSIFRTVDDIIKDIQNIRVILIAGPSSSGKTTLSHKMSIFFRINGIEPLTLGMDDYFVNREYTPIDDNGEYNFENINAVDIELFDEHLAKLIQGETVETPIFDFHTGMRSENTRTMKMNPKQILIVEGIHCLNDSIAENIPKKNKRRIYISALTQLNIDHYNPISSTDNRILRRMTRDMQFRNTSPAETLKRWQSVQKGEDTNIFPYQENADYFLNTALVYELAVLKPFISPKLREVDTTDIYYHEARRLLGILDFIRPIDASLVPPSSLLREFIGGSAFFEDN